MGVPPPTQIANTITFAKNAKKQGMERISAPNRSCQDLLRSRPKYLHHNLWNPESSFTPTVTEWSVPLPCPSHLELNNPVAHQMIFEHLSLFKIVTPINVNLFECLLSDHPNPSFINSVCIGLHEGFWPWADTLKDGYPSIYDGARPTPCDNKKADFIYAQCDIEILKDHFSASFGPDLFPGMYCMPVHAIPKPNSTDLCMVTDHSTGPFL